MKNGWPSKTLAEVCHIRPPKSEARARLSGNELVSFLPMEDLRAHEKFACATQEKPLSAVAGSYTYFADGDVLLAKITPCFENGKLGIADGLTKGVGFGSSEYIVFRPNGSLSKDWLYYYLSREDFRLEGASRMSGAVGHKRVGKEFIEGYPIPIPPLPEQQRIVGILDEAFDDIATTKVNAKKNVQNARALFESYLQSVFIQRGDGWEEKPLGECVQDISTGPFGSLLHKHDYEHGGIPLVNPVNIEGDTIIPDERKAVGKRTAERLSRYALREDDVVIGRRGEIGRCAVVGHDQAGWLCGTGCFIIRPSHKTDPHFITHLLRSRPYRGKLEAMAERATMPSISNTDLANLVIGLPSVAQQRRTVTLLAGC